MSVLRAICLTYKTASISVRESISFSESDSSAFLLKVREVCALSELMLVSTCNRTEFYYLAKEDQSEKIVSILAAEKGVQSSTIMDNFRFLDGNESIQHLFSVSLGLDSQILGDIQISSQVKKAYQQSADLDLAGPLLHRLMHTIFYANKRVVQETTLQDGNASTASVSVDVIKSFVSKIEKPKITLVGLGEIGQNVLDNLQKVDCQINLVNRTRQKAEELATQENIKVYDLADLCEIVKGSDVVISAATAPEPLIKQQYFDQKHNHKLLIDLSLPRGIEKEVGDLPGIVLYNVDDLTEKTARALKIRQRAIPQVNEIINESIDGFDSWKDEMEVSPTIQKLKAALDDVRKTELSRHIGKMSESEMELVDVITKNMLQKVLKIPVLNLKAACKRGEAETLVEVLNDLFDLERTKSEKK